MATRSSGVRTNWTPAAVVYTGTDVSIKEGGTEGRGLISPIDRAVFPMDAQDVRETIEAAASDAKRGVAAAEGRVIPWRIARALVAVVSCLSHAGNINIVSIL